MEYFVSKSVLQPQVEELVSRSAARTVSEAGESMYDSLRITSRDKNTVDRLFMDAENAIIERFRDVVYYDYSTLVFNLPDFDEGMEGAAKDLLDKFVVHYVASFWFGLKKVAVADDFSAMAQGYMTRAVNLLRQRMDYQS